MGGARSASTIVDTEAYVLACYRYIEANPVRARMVERAEDHPWSSHGAKALGRQDPLVTEHECYRALGGTELARRTAYRSMFDDDLAAETIDILRDATQRGWVPGRQSFREQIEAALGRKVAPPVRRRPRKGGGG